MSLSKYINSCNLFIGLYTTYLFFRAQATSSFTGYLLLLITVISFGYFIYVQFKMQQPRMLKWLSILFYMFTIYGVLYILFGETVHDYNGSLRQIDYLKKIAASLLPVYPFFYFERKGLFRLSYLNFWIPIFILVSIFSFANYYSNMLEQAQANGVAATEFTNNTGYLFVSLLPLIFLRKGSSIINYLYIGVCALFIVMGVKRGAIAIGGLCITYYLVSNLQRNKGSKKLWFILLSFIAVIIAGTYISDFIAKSSYFAYRLNNTLEGNMGGRDNIYSQLIDVFLNSDLAAMILGHGADSTIYFTTMLAHNDWLELLVNQGILGVVIYLCYFIAIYKSWLQYRRDHTVGICLSGLFIVLFLKTMFSMSYTEYTLFICMAYGYCMGYISKLKINRVNGRKS